MPGPVALLDVNVLIALFDPDHIHHDVAHDWFADNRSRGWATCPLTQNGFVRTAAALARTREPVSVRVLAEGLRTFTASGRHSLWPDDVSLLDATVFNHTVLLGHQQLTDIYLLGLAVKHKGVLVTFDRKIPIEAVTGASKTHVESLDLSD